MRRLFGVVLAGAILILPAFSQSAFAQQAQAPQKTTYTGAVVIAAYVVNPDKTADYEKVIAQVKDALAKSPRPEAKQQLAGWKVMRNSTAQPDGGIVYVHVIGPVVPDADYSITNIVYEVVTDPMARLEFYNMYRGALKQALFVIQGPLTSDFSK
jgi:hypothetical protein